MEVVRGVARLPIDGPTCVTVGFFDGVHVGHRDVIARTVELARSSGSRSVAVTFDRHPREILTPDRAPKLLTTAARRETLIEGLGIDILLVVEFNRDLSRWSPGGFARRVLAAGLGARRVVVGSNFTFGHGAAGNVEVLAGLGRELDFEVEDRTLVEVEGRRVSSSAIRADLEAGELVWPRAALGRRHEVEGEVIRGAGRGRGLGWPTANLRLEERLQLPGEGVFAGLAITDPGSETASRAAAINVGTNPTFGGEALHVEAYLLDFEGDLIGRRLRIEFWYRLRDERRFDSGEALARQIGADVDRTRELVSLPGNAPRVG